MFNKFFAESKDNIESSNNDDKLGAKNADSDQVPTKPRRRRAADSDSAGGWMNSEKSEFVNEMDSAQETEYNPKM